MLISVHSSKEISVDTVHWENFKFLYEILPHYGVFNMKNQCLIWQYYISCIKYCADILFLRGVPEISFLNLVLDTEIYFMYKLLTSMNQ